MASKTAPLLKLTIQSSATLTKGDEILIDALGLLSGDSKRTIMNMGEIQANFQNMNSRVGGSLDMRDGFVYFGCKKSIKQHQTNPDNESTTIVSIFYDVHMCFRLLFTRSLLLYRNAL